MGNIYKYNVEDERILWRFMGRFDENLIDKMNVVFAQPILLDPSLWTQH